MGVSGEIRHQHGIVPEREKTGMQTPEGVVETATLQKDDRWLSVVERFAAGAGKYLFAVNFKIHA